jgi:hypothetical protein
MDFRCLPLVGLRDIDIDRNFMRYRSSFVI